MGIYQLRRAENSFMSNKLDTWIQCRNTLLGKNAAVFTNDFLQQCGLEMLLPNISTSNKTPILS